MIRLASEQDLPAIAAIYEAILDHEDATGLHYTGWQRGAYPTLDTAKGILAAGTLYVGTDEDGTVWGSMNFNDWQLPEYAKGRWTIPAEDSEVAVIHTLTIDPKRAGQGLARQMIAFAEDSARKQGKTVMRFDTGTENEVSNHLYPAIGYHLADVVDTFFMGYTHRPLISTKRSCKAPCKPVVYSFRRWVGGVLRPILRYCCHERS
ncbi:MAG: GNAT family N-acetyltransferase [Oscillospiraceae bacterium]